MRRKMKHQEQMTIKRWIQKKQKRRVKMMNQRRGRKMINLSYLLA